MKSIIIQKIKLTGVAFLILVFVGCEDFLTVPAESKLTDELLFQTVTQAQMAAYGAYNRMCHPNYGRKIHWNGADCDEIRIRGGISSNGRTTFCRYIAGPGEINDDIAPLWNNLYVSIERANICIHKIPGMSLYNNGTEAEKAELRNLHGEMLAMRALCYFDLIKHFGCVPFYTEPARAEDEMFGDRVSRDIIYDRIIEDLLEAVELTRWRLDQPAPMCRFNKGAVKALLARIALHAAGYSLRWDLATGSDMSMRTRDDQARITQLYTIARDQCRDIINDPGANHRLNPDYLNIWKNINTSKLDTEYGESMFEFGMWSASNEDGGASAGQLMQNMSPPVPNTSMFSAGGSGGSQMRMMPYYYFSFKDGDIRRDITICDHEINAQICRPVDGMRNFYMGKLRAWWSDQPMWSTYSNINWSLIRYSDVLLMFAEADNKLNGGPTTAGIDALKQVRKRAFKGNEALIDAEVYTGLSEAQFLEAVINERWFEFGAESIRKWDLIRWNKLGERIQATKDWNEWIAKLPPESEEIPRYVYAIYLPEANMVNASVNPLQKVYLSFTGSNPPRHNELLAQGYTRRSYRDGINDGELFIFARDFKANHSELFPIPSNVIANNPMLSQHPGHKGTGAVE